MVRSTGVAAAQQVDAVFEADLPREETSDAPPTGDPISGAEQGHGVAAPAEGGIDHPTCTDRPHQFHDRVREDGDVVRGRTGCHLVHGQPPGALATEWKRGE